MCCDAPSVPSPNADPQVGAAALAQTDIAKQEAAFSQNYMNTVETPAIQQEQAASKQTQEEQQQMFGLNYNETKLNDSQYQQYGIPAQQKYYDMVDKYSQAGQQEIDAANAVGDVTNAASVQRGALDRNLASRGVSANSGMAVYNQAQQSQATSANAAAAANQARNAARSLGMSLTGDAANFGRGGASNVIGFGQQASGNSMNSYNTASNAVTAGNAGAALPMQSFGSQGSMYGQQMGNYMSGAVANTQAIGQANAANSQGIGSAIGSVAGIAAMAMM